MGDITKTFTDEHKADVTEAIYDYTKPSSFNAWKDITYDAERIKHPLIEGYPASKNFRSFSDDLHLKLYNEINRVFGNIKETDYQYTYLMESLKDSIYVYTAKLRYLHEAITIQKRDGSSVDDWEIFLNDDFSQTLDNLQPDAAAEKAIEMLRVMRYGAAPNYEDIMTEGGNGVNCYAFAVGYTGGALQPGEWNGNKLTSYNAGLNDAIISDLLAAGYSIRELNGPDGYISADEYRIAVVPGFSEVVNNGTYHVVTQTSDGRWAEVPGIGRPSRILEDGGVAPSQLYSYEDNNGTVKYIPSATTYYAIIPPDEIPTNNEAIESGK